MGTIYKITEERLKVNPYIGVSNQALETLVHLCFIQDYCQTKALILTSFWQSRARGVNGNKRNRYKLLNLANIEWSMYKERILRWGKWSYVQGNSEVNFNKMNRFLSEIQEKYTKLANIVKISISFNRLVFPMNFNIISQPLTVMADKSIRKEARQCGKYLDLNPTCVYVYRYIYTAHQQKLR